MGRRAWQATVHGVNQESDRTDTFTYLKKMLDSFSFSLELRRYLVIEDKHRLPVSSELLGLIILGVFFFASKYDLVYCLRSL